MEDVICQIHYVESRFIGQVLLASYSAIKNVRNWTFNNVRLKYTHIYIYIYISLLLAALSFKKNVFHKCHIKRKKKNMNIGIATHEHKTPNK